MNGAKFTEKLKELGFDRRMLYWLFKTKSNKLHRLSYIPVEKNIKLRLIEHRSIYKAEENPIFVIVDNYDLALKEVKKYIDLH
jgi:hypothetical protein